MRKNEGDIKSLIKKEIKRLHERADGDEKRLLNQVADKYKPITYNYPQLIAHMSMQVTKQLTLEWGRGAGKSTFIGAHVKDLLHQLPRGVVAFVGPSYKKVKTEILPSIKHGLEMHGLYEDLHYFVGRRPPRSWNFQKAYKMPDSVDNILWFFNGFILQLISQDIPGSGRGGNYDGLIADECAILDSEHLSESVNPALRGSNVAEFRDKPLFLSRVYASSTPLTAEGRWFIKREELGILHPDKYKFITADARFNLKNLAPGYFENAKIDTLPLIYNAEYLNKRVPIVLNGFYPKIDTKIHPYTNYDNEYIRNNGVGNCNADKDHNPSLPFYIGIDWGASINAMSVNQFDREDNEFRTIHNFYSLGLNNEIQSDMIQKFMDYYEPRIEKVIYLYYDPTGNVSTGITKKTRAEIAVRQLRDAGWTVQVMTHSRTNIEHELKYQLWIMIHSEEHPGLPRWRINKGNAYETWVSMTNAQAKTARGKVKKDKSSERSSNKERQYATDLSDAIDVVVFKLFGGYLQYGPTRTELPG